MARFYCSVSVPAYHRVQAHVCNDTVCVPCTVGPNHLGDVDAELDYYRPFISSDCNYPYPFGTSVQFRGTAQTTNYLSVCEAEVYKYGTFLELLHFVKKEERLKRFG